MSQPNSAEQYRTWHLRTCARCGRTAAKAANWSDGPICRTCLDHALRTYGTCPQCNTQRLLPGRDQQGEAICRDCAKINRNFTCGTCGAEGYLVGGRCDRCRLKVQLTTLLDDGSGQVNPELQPVLDRLCAMPRPDMRLAWLRRQRPNQLLSDLASGHLPLTHETFAALPNTKTVTYVSDLLIDTAVLPPADRQLGIYQRWLREYCAEIPDPAHVQLLHRYLTWRQLPDLRRTAAHRALTVGSTNHCRSEIRAIHAWLCWLADHQLTLSQCQQVNLDTWAIEQPQVAHHSRRFLRWAITNGLTPTLTEPARPAAAPTTAGMSQGERLDALRRLLTDTTIAVRTRIAGTVLLLYAQPVTRILQLTIGDVITTPDGGCELRLGEPASPVPAPLVDLLRTYLTSRPNPSIGDADSTWLFPGRRPGQPLHPATLRLLLRQAGIRIGAGRLAAIQQLVQDMPPPVAALALGYHHVSTTRIATQTGSPWSNYARSRIGPPSMSTNDR